MVFTNLVGKQWAPLLSQVLYPFDEGEQVR